MTRVSLVMGVVFYRFARCYVTMVVVYRREAGVYVLFYKVLFMMMLNIVCFLSL